MGKKVTQKWFAEYSVDQNRYQILTLEEKMMRDNDQSWEYLGSSSTYEGAYLLVEKHRRFINGSYRI